MSIHRALAPAKINLGLFVGPTREGDGRHELISVMQSISLADQLTLEDAPAGAPADETLCPGLPGAPEENLASRALAAFRAATGWQAGPQLLSIDKRIPVAAGLGGGSADAAAALRLAHHASGLGDRQLLLGIAAELGADVSAQIAPGRWLASGAGEVLEELPAPRAPLGVLVLASNAGLSTGAVYAEADRRGAQREIGELEQLGQALSAALADGAPLPAARELLDNDLQRAAVALCPEIADALRAARTAGSDPALVSGSGPTVIGLFSGSPGAPGGGLKAAEHAAATIATRVPAPICAVAVAADFGAPQTL
jgi:4-diphosphocytidyl-2-C-methyl-D-erythritol kinase